MSIKYIERMCYQELKFLITQKETLLNDSIIFKIFSLEEEDFLQRKEILFWKIKKIQERCPHEKYLTFERFFLKTFKQELKECAFCAKRF